MTHIVPSSYSVSLPEEQVYTCTDVDPHAALSGIYRYAGAGGKLQAAGHGNWRDYFPPLAALRQRPPSADEIVTRSVARTLALCGLDAEPIPRRAKANWRNSTNNKPMSLRT